MLQVLIQVLVHCKFWWCRHCKKFSCRWICAWIAGDLNVNGGNITLDDAHFGLLNTTATTVNFAGFCYCYYYWSNYR
jgi:hypothetical protein